VVPAKRIALIAAVLASAPAATALASVPKGGAYSGFTSGPVILGFAPPVSFTLPSHGKDLTRFRYSTFGCDSFGGQSDQSGDEYLASSAVKSIGKVSLSSSGAFSVNNVKSTYQSGGQKTLTTTSISGRFTSTTKASGTITFSQTFKVRGHSVPGCGPASVTFTVERK
jgi:hypothetical protein